MQRQQRVQKQDQRLHQPPTLIARLPLTTFRRMFRSCLLFPVRQGRTGPEA